jgi:hypothetical protein
MSRTDPRRMVSSGMLRSVALVRTDVSEELSASFIRVTRIGEIETTLRLLVTANVVPISPILVTLMKEELRSSETSGITRATQRNIPEDIIIHSHRRENLKSYIDLLRLTGIRAASSSVTKNRKELNVSEMKSMFSSVVRWQTPVLGRSQ